MAGEKKENSMDVKETKAAKAKEGAAPRKKKLAVVFHSQNSVNHKNHPLGRNFSERRKNTATEQPVQKETPKKTSPNGRPLPPGTARVTPLRELNEIQRKKAEQEAREEAQRLAMEKEQAAREKAAKEEAAREEAAKAKAAKEEAERQKALSEKAEQAKRQNEAAETKEGEKGKDATTDRKAEQGQLVSAEQTSQNVVRKEPPSQTIAEKGQPPRNAAKDGRESAQGRSPKVKKETPAAKTQGTVSGEEKEGASAEKASAAVKAQEQPAASISDQAAAKTPQAEESKAKTPGTPISLIDAFGLDGAPGAPRPRLLGRIKVVKEPPKENRGARGQQDRRQGGAKGRGPAERGARPDQGAGRNRGMDRMQGQGTPRRDDAAAAQGMTDKAGNFAKREQQKSQKKVYGQKNIDTEKANISQKNRTNRKQQKYGAAQSYERDDQLVYRGPKKGGKAPFVKPEAVKVEEEIKSILLPEIITLKELGEKMKKKPADIIKKFFMQGKMLTLNTELSYEEAENIALEYDILCEKEEKVDVIAELVQDSQEDAEAELVARPPVVCVMGHVDHGKTSILDAIRKTNVTQHEHGGITQSIGAYQVMLKVNGEDRVITFLDTPGHEAFTAMRMRGAQSTDIAVLVVAADDGIMPQTVEAINHAKAANTEIIVAINKIDKPTANPEKVKQELMKYDLVPEDYGGTTICCPVSAKTGEGLENLLENIVLEADVMELKANPNRKAYGVVVEAELDKGRGSVARLLVQKGTLHVGDVVSVGSAYGKVRAMIDDKGRRIKQAVPSMPVEILGLNSVPNAGEIFKVQENEKEAKAYAAAFVSENKQRMVEESRKKVSLDALFDQIKEGKIKELPIVVKADVQGSVEAVRDSLEKIRNEEVKVKVIHSGVGAISESDVVLASASNAIVIGFDVKPDATAKDIADREHVDVRLYNIIYKAIEDVENAMKGMLKPVFEEKIIGHAVIRQIFKSSGVGNIAGSYVLDGMVQRDAKARITRGDNQIYDGEIISVKRFKDDVKEVRTGYECGLVFSNFDDIQVDDQIEAYVMEEVKRF